jgi:hypothetical protein
VPDWGARANVIDKLLTQGYGRPRSEDDEAGAGFVLRPVLVFRASDPDRAAAEAAANYGGVVTSAADGTRTVVIDGAAAHATDTAALPATTAASTGSRSRIPSATAGKASSSVSRRPSSSSGAKRSG